ncbi:MAG: transcriptional repressor LexA [Eubacteriaceae bacterium]|nr:transcriptional repressor LexA [Eubacteriaceae bacterium]
MYDDLTGVQIQILEYLKSEKKIHSYSPSVREICGAVGLKSTSSVQYQLNNLEQKGYIRRNPLKPRTIEIIEKNNTINEMDMVTVPIIGKVAAGTPILAVENYEDYFPLPASFVGNAECFMLLVQGSSMINAGILDGDYVIVRHQNVAQNGEIVVAMIEDEATVKTFYHEENAIRLQPENPMMAPIYSKSVTILGKVIGVIRRM